MDTDGDRTRFMPACKAGALLLVLLAHKWWRIAAIDPERIALDGQRNRDAVTAVRQIEGYRLSSPAAGSLIRVLRFLAGGIPRSGSLNILSLFRGQRVLDPVSAAHEEDKDEIAHDQ